MGAGPARALKGAFALYFAAGAAYHAAGLLRPEWTEPSPPWRKGLFVAVNAAAAAGLLRYRPALFWAYAALAAQQVLGHGLYGWEVWTREGRVDWASAAVLLFFPALLAALAREGVRPASRPA